VISARIWMEGEAAKARPSMTKVRLQATALRVALVLY
jgi:hypothetical protein